MELIAKINAFVATPNEKSVKIDVSNSRFGRLRDLSESCSARQPALPAGAEATSRVVFLAGTDTADKDGTSKRTTAIAIFGMTKEGGAHDRYGQLPALLDFIIRTNLVVFRKSFLAEVGVQRRGHFYVTKDS